MVLALAVGAAKDNKNTTPVTDAKVAREIVTTVSLSLVEFPL
jgi:hypothetical protein